MGQDVFLLRNIHLKDRGHLRQVLYYYTCLTLIPPTINMLFKKQFKFQYKNFFLYRTTSQIVKSQDKYQSSFLALHSDPAPLKKLHCIFLF